MSALHNFRRLLQAAPRGWVAGLLLLMVVTGMTEGVGILLLVPLLGILAGNNRGGNPVIQGLLDALNAAGLPVSVGGLLLAFLLLIFFRSGVQYARERLGASLQHRVVDELRTRCFAALLGVEWRWIVAGRQSDHANLLLTDVSRVGVGLNFGLSLLASLATLLAYLLTAFALSWQMTTLALLSGGLVFWLLAGQRREALMLGLGLGRANRAMHGNLQESLAGIKLAKILGNEAHHLALFTRTTTQLRLEQLRFMASTCLSRALFQVGGALLLSAYLYLGLQVWALPLPELLTLVLLFSRLIPLFMSGHQQYYHYLHALPAHREIERLLSECQRAAEPVDALSNPLIPIEQAICFDAVTVRYAGRKQAALDAVSLCFPARTTTAIMGASGAGKSTLADVLMGLLQPDLGHLKVDGEIVADGRRMAWRQSVAYVPQDAFRFHDSIRNNLLWGKADASEADMLHTLRLASADFVFSLPAGLDTVVGDGGVRLSGGERQRLALARALLRTPSLLILDEATSALDLNNEARVREAIEQLHGNLTVVIIGHRLPTLEHADQVIQLAEGRIVARGTWAEINTSRNLSI